MAPLLLRPDQVEHLNLATGYGKVGLSKSMTEVFNARYGTKVSHTALDIMWHHSPGGPSPQRLMHKSLTVAQVEALKAATRDGQWPVTWKIAENFNSLFRTNYEPEYLEDLYRWSLGGPGPREPNFPATQSSNFPRLPY